MFSGHSGYGEKECKRHDKPVEHLQVVQAQWVKDRQARLGVQAGKDMLNSRKACGVLHSSNQSRSRATTSLRIYWCKKAKKLLAADSKRSQKEVTHWLCSHLLWLRRMQGPKTCTSLKCTSWHMPHNKVHENTYIFSGLHAALRYKVARLLRTKAADVGEMIKV